MSTDPISVSLRMEGAGWASIEFDLGNRSYLMNGVSHIFDPMDDLLRAGAVAATRLADTYVRFFGEPMEWRLRLRPVAQDEHQMELQIGTFPDLARTVGGDLGDVVLSGICSRQRFGRTLLNAFWPWSEREEEYQRLWYEPFPRRGFELLQTAVSS